MSVLAKACLWAGGKVPEVVFKEAPGELSCERARLSEKPINLKLVSQLESQNFILRMLIFDRTGLEDCRDHRVCAEWRPFDRGHRSWGA
ncbi:MAG: hypothetical protein HY360_14325 [Verrucomicrobia bacterium]|nr:hypothetical protein [Verrucomicrobiota bacterium]